MDCNFTTFVQNLILNHCWEDLWQKDFPCIAVVEIFALIHSYIMYRSTDSWKYWDVSDYKFERRRSLLQSMFESYLHIVLSVYSSTDLLIYQHHWSSALVGIKSLCEVKSWIMIVILHLCYSSMKHIRGFLGWSFEFVSIYFVYFWTLLNSGYEWKSVCKLSAKFVELWARQTRESWVAFLCSRKVDSYWEYRTAPCNMHRHWL